MESPSPRKRMPLTLTSSVEQRNSQEELYYSLAGENNPLLNDVILATLFGFLNGPDLMNCRIVCTKWKTLSEKFYRQRIQIGFNCKIGDNESSAAKLAIFNEVFSKCCILEAFPFTAVSFQGQIESSFLNQFFSSEIGRHMKFLKFSNIQVIGRRGKPLVRYYLNKLLRTLALKSLIVTWDKDTAFWNPNVTEMIIRTSCIKTCALLCLERCHLLLNGKISPSVLIVENCFVRTTKRALNEREMKSERLTVNESVDFSKIKHFIWNDILKSIPIDMKDKTVVLDEFVLEDRKYLPNWVDASWTINKLLLKIPRVVQKSQLNVKYLCIEDWVVLDFAVIPKTVEKLVIMESKNVNNIRMKFSDGIVSLPNLKYLKLRCINVHCLQLFYNCEKLEDAVLEGVVHDPNITLNVNRIPKSIRRLSLQCVELSSDPGIFPLHSLVLQYYSVFWAKKVLKKLRPATLILDRPFSYKDNYAHSRKVRVINQYVSKEQWNDFYSFTQDIQVENLIVGPLDRESFLTPMLESILKGTEEEKKYCLFHENDTKVIPYSAFKQFKAFRRSPISSNGFWREEENEQIAKLVNSSKRKRYMQEYEAHRKRMFNTVLL